MGLWNRRTCQGVGVRVLVGVCLAALATGCGSATDAGWRAQLCAHFEADDYPELETLATRTLDGLDHSVQRSSTCEERGHPRATLVAEVVGRASRTDVLALLVERGWLPDEEVGGGVYEADRGFVVRLSESWDGGPVVVVRFSKDA